MRNFIIFFFFVCVFLFFFGNTTNAQYITNNPSTQVATEQPQRVNLFDIPEYQEAKQEVKDGKTLFFLGLGCSAIGGALIGLSPSLAATNTWYSSSALMIEHDASANIALIGGTAFAITGVILNVIGTCKWANGAATIRDIRIAYMISNNGLVVYF